jgi:UDP-glucose 4-epimerase
MNILVTGSSGFVGTHLVEKLREIGHKVVGMDIKNGQFSDIRAYMNCDKFMKKIDVVIHLTSLINVQESIKDPIIYFNDNEKGLLNMLYTANEHKVKRFIFASSAAADNPSSPYGVTKINGEQWCSLFYDCYGLSTISLRFFNIYGKGTEKGVIPLWIDKIRNGESPVVNGDGEQIRDFVYVEDVVDAIIRAMESDFTGIYEVGTGIGTSILELCDTFLTEMNSNVKIKFGKGLEGEIRESISDKKRWLPKWKPNYLLIEKGIREMLK